MILDGRIVRDKIAEYLRGEMMALSPKPTLAIIQVGNVPESTAYIGQKKKFGESVGAEVRHLVFDYMVEEKSLKDEIDALNTDKNVHGIIVQLPLSEHLSKEKIISFISPAKDVDGLTDENQGKLASGDDSGLLPATARGVMRLLDFYKISVRDKKVAVLGRSRLVGGPIAHLLKARGADVAVCHSKTKNIPEITRGADIVIVAIGKPRHITEKFVSPGQVVVDVGITVEKSGLLAQSLVGDVDFEKVSKIVSAISPVPGGVGPLTVASLFENLLQAYKSQRS